jgi:Ca2+-transporting ATPase
MGKSGSEITKEAADVVLLDDSFATIVKSVAFGRNVYRNLQRFILFQLSVNVSALLFITVSAILGYKSPFNTLQLLWINVIMDGPPAITLGLYNEGKNLMKNSPVKRNQSIVGKKMLIRILFNGVFVSTLMCLQYFFNILRVSSTEIKGATFTLFIIFQLFNAFNSRELGTDSIFKNLGQNKIMAVTFLITFILQIIIVQVAYPLFDISPLKLVSWIKLLGLGITIVLVTEIYKKLYNYIAEKKTKDKISVNKKSLIINKN